LRNKPSVLKNHFRWSEREMKLTVLELIGSVFDNASTSSLAVAALARLGKDLSIDKDTVVLTREEEGEIKLRASVRVNMEHSHEESCWERLIALMFATSDTEMADAASARLAAIGIGTSFTSRFLANFRSGNYAVLVLADESIRDQVIGVFRGLQGRVVRVRLPDEIREVWRTILFAPLEDPK
jgi:uncharacterized membrane protein